MKAWLYLLAVGLCVNATGPTQSARASAASTLHATSVALARYNQDGTLDRSFNGSGVISVRAPDQSFANALAIQPDARIVVVGAVSSLTSGGVEFYVERINPDGSPDTTFGSAGALTTRIAGLDSEAHAVAAQADGKLVVAGTAFGSGSQRDQFGLARYNTDGSLDDTFGTAGTVGTSVSPGGAEARGVVIQPDGKIVVAGTAFGSGSMDDHFALVRYDADGSLDSSFGSGGVVITDFSLLEPSGQVAPFDRATALTLQPDGKLLVVGSTGGMSTDFAIARHNPDGSLDASFGMIGRAKAGLPPGAQAFAAAVQPDGRIVMAGSGASSAGGEPFLIARQNGDGSPDTTFGVGGQATASFEGGTSGARAIAVQPDGMLVVGGSGYAPVAPASDTVDGGFAVQRWQTDGTLDPRFGTGGTALTTVGDAGSTINGLALQADGRIVAAGLANYRVVVGATFTSPRYHRTAL